MCSVYLMAADSLPLLRTGRLGNGKSPRGGLYRPSRRQNVSSGSIRVRVGGEIPKITRQRESDRVRDSVAATGTRRSLAAPLFHQVLAVVHPSPNAPGCRLK
jgi:hypothetical protein